MSLKNKLCCLLCRLMASLGLKKGTSCSKSLCSRGTCSATPAPTVTKAKKKDKNKVSLRTKTPKV